MRPRSSVLMLSTMDRRLSLGEDMSRALAWTRTVPREPGPGVTRHRHTASDVDALARTPALQRQMAQRRALAHELYDSEKAYVRGLHLVDTYYYTPLLTAAQQPLPIVSRSTLNRMFANFYDILQLSKELLCRLDERVGHASPAHAPWDPLQDEVGDLLAPIAPFLKMYSLFMQNFSQAMQSIEAERRANERFRRFLADANQKTHSEHQRVMALGLEAQLLTIVQRVPRYKLLLHGLLVHTPEWHRDYELLRESYTVVDHTATYINEHMRQHELTLTALELQRTLLGLKEPLVVPGRRLLKHGTLLKTRRKDIQPRRFYLFSDCLVVSSAGTDSLVPVDADVPFEHPHSTHGDADSAPAGPAVPSLHRLPWSSMQYLTHKLPLTDLTVIGYDDLPLSVSAGAAASSPGFPNSASLPNLAATHADPRAVLRHRFEILSPHCSFSLYAPTRGCQQSWISAIREAQDEYRASLPSIRQSTELASRPASLSSSTSSDALDEELTTPGAHLSLSLAEAQPPASASLAVPLFGRHENLPVLEHYLAPVWVPDSLAARCRRCSEPFTLWRRKHHCRLCGHVFCHACASCYFRICDAGGVRADVRTRACISCFRSTFHRVRRLQHTEAHTVSGPEPLASLAPPIAPFPVLSSVPSDTSSARGRRWSIVSVPQDSPSTPRVHVQTKTTVSPMREDMPVQDSAPTTPTRLPLAPPSSAAAWLQSLLRTPAPSLCTP